MIHLIAILCILFFIIIIGICMYKDSHADIDLIQALRNNLETPTMKVSARGGLTKKTGSIQGKE